jgi:Macro domain
LMRLRSPFVHAAEHGHEQIVGLVVPVDGAADLRHPQRDAEVDEDGEGVAELVAVEGAPRLPDDHGVVVTAWRSAFADTPEVEIRRGSLLDVDADAWVSPTNERGRMDGGVDAVVKRYLGAGIQVRVQRAIRDRFGGRLPVSSAVCVPSGADVPRYLISTPTMRQSSQNVSDTMNVALACAAALFRDRAVVGLPRVEKISTASPCVPGHGSAARADLRPR